MDGICVARGSVYSINLIKSDNRGELYWNGTAELVSNFCIFFVATRTRFVGTIDEVLVEKLIF